MAAGALAPALGPEVANSGEGAADPIVVRTQLLAPPGSDLSGLSELVAQAPGRPLSREAVRRTLQLIDDTGRFENVLAYLQFEPGGAVLLLQLVPKLRILAVAFDGNRRFSDGALRDKLELRAGDEFTPDRVQAAAVELQAIYRRAGYQDVQVSWTSSRSPVLASIFFRIEEGRPVAIRRVELTGSPALPSARLQDTLALAPGSTLDADRIDESLKRIEALYRREGRYLAEVGPATTTQVSAGFADVVIPLRAGPRFELSFLDNRTFSDRRLRREMDYEGEGKLDDVTLQRVVERLEDFYRREGFLTASVQLRTERRGDLVREIFEVREGFPYRVAGFTLSGVSSPEAGALEAEYRSSVRGDRRPPFLGRPESAEADAIGVSGRPSAPAPAEYRPDPDIYVAEAYAAASARLADRYREEGYLSARVEPPVIDLDLELHQIAVRIAVSEGPRTYLTAIVFEGSQFGPVDLAAMAQLVRGQPLSQSALDRSRKAILRGLAGRGFPFARVEATQQLHATGRDGSLRFKIRDGPLVHLGRILVRGNLHTVDAFIRENVELSHGQRYDPEAIQRSTQALQALGIFDQVQITLLEPDTAESTKDVLIGVHERKAEEIVVGGGYSLVDGPRAYIEYTHGNLFGRAIRFQSELRFNYFPWSYLALSNPTGSLVLEGLPPAAALTGKDNFFGFGGRLNAVLSDPKAFRLGGDDSQLRLEGLVERIDRPYYAFSRAAFIPGVSVLLRRRLTLGLQASLEFDQINTYWADLDQVFSRLSFFDLTNLRFPSGQGVTTSVGPSATWDQRDDPVNPHRGFAASIRAKWVGGSFTASGPSTGSLLFGEGGAPGAGTLPIDLVSASGSIAGYLPLGPALVFVLSLKGGRIFPVGNSFVIPTQRFFLGGPDSDRGFQMDMMLPEDVRQSLHEDVQRCGQSATGASCSVAAQILRTPGNQLPSPGGQVFENLRGEVRFPLYGRVVDGALFVDAGNLWSDPTRFSLLTLRPAAGAGVRVPSPIGPAAFDLGFNLSPDEVVNEQLVQLHLSIGLF